MVLNLNRKFQSLLNIWGNNIMKEEFLRTGSIIGEDGIEKLCNSTVAVFGIGGVGSYALEALVRSGVGTIYIYDNDTVTKSNINRQLVAMQSTIGMFKTEVAKKHCFDINPDCNVVENQIFVTPQSQIPFEKFDYIVDAVDNVTAKLFIISKAYEIGVPVISVMGTGNKLDPTFLKVSDISQTSGCPLARVMRHELKVRNIKKLDVVWSIEKPIKPKDFGERNNLGRISPGSMSMVPGVAGLIAASVVVKKLIK